MHLKCMLLYKVDINALRKNLTSECIWEFFSYMCN